MLQNFLYCILLRSLYFAREYIRYLFLLLFCNCI
nr:MAG TPA: hypothetical protein [Caudoviricetes sp.]